MTGVLNGDDTTVRLDNVMFSKQTKTQIKNDSVQGNIMNSRYEGGIKIKDKSGEDKY